MIHPSWNKFNSILHKECSEYLLIKFDTPNTLIPLLNYDTVDWVNFTVARISFSGGRGQKYWKILPTYVTLHDINLLKMTSWPVIKNKKSACKSIRCSLRYIISPPSGGRGRRFEFCRAGQHFKASQVSDCLQNLSWDQIETIWGPCLFKHIKLMITTRHRTLRGRSDH